MKTMKAQVDIISLTALLFIVAIAFFATAQIWSGLNSSPSFQHLTNSTSQGRVAVKNVPFLGGAGFLGAGFGGFMRWSGANAP